MTKQKGSVFVLFCFPFCLFWFCVFFLRQKRKKRKEKEKEMGLLGGFVVCVCLFGLKFFFSFSSFFSFFLSFFSFSFSFLLFPFDFLSVRLTVLGSDALVFPKEHQGFFHFFSSLTLKRILSLKNFVEFVSE